MLAPSEKHLEDWIVSRSGCIVPCDPDRYQVIARQVRLPSGIADLIVFDGNSLWIYELKKDLIDAKALAQILRYRADLMRIWRKACKPLVSNFELSYALFPFCINALLIGHSTYEDILFSAAGAYISVYLYDYADGGYRCQYTDVENMPEPVAEQFAYGAIGEAMRGSLAAYLSEKAEFAP